MDPKLWEIIVPVIGSLLGVIIGFLLSMFSEHKKIRHEREMEYRKEIQKHKDSIIKPLFILIEETWSNIAVLHETIKLRPNFSDWKMGFKTSEIKHTWESFQKLKNFIHSNYEEIGFILPSPFPWILMRLDEFMENNIWSPLINKKMPTDDDLVETINSLMTIQKDLRKLIGFELDVKMESEFSFGITKITRFERLKNAFSRKKVSKKLKSLAPFIVAGLLVGSFIGIHLVSFDSGQIFVANHIRNNKEVVENLASSRVQSQLEIYFPTKLNYTELFTWQSTKMNYSQNRDFHSDPLEILDYGKGACLEYAVVYMASCLANDIPARLLVTGYVIPGKIDHAWVEVNPSEDGETWIHIEPADCAAGIQQGRTVDELTCFDNPAMHYNKDIQLVLAFELTEDRAVVIKDRTEYYNPNISEQE